MGAISSPTIMSLIPVQGQKRSQSQYVDQRIVIQGAALLPF